MGIHDSHAVNGRLAYNNLAPESFHRQTVNRHPRLWEQSGPRSELLVPAEHRVVPNLDTCGPNAVAWVQKSLAHQAQPIPRQHHTRLPSDAGQDTCAHKQIVDVSTFTGITPCLHLAPQLLRHSSTLKKGT